MLGKLRKPPLTDSDIQLRLSYQIHSLHHPLDDEIRFSVAFHPLFDGVPGKTVRTILEKYVRFHDVVMRLLIVLTIFLIATVMQGKSGTSPK